jgi:hypothetical protein
VFELFDEFAAAYAHGDRPDAEVFLTRAGDDRQDLAALLEEFLRRVPAPQPTEDDVRLLGLMLADEPPLLSLRVRRGIKVDDVVSGVIDRLGLDPAKRPKVKRYYQRLEGGLLDPNGISGRLRAALADIFGTSVEQAIRWAPPPVAEPTFLRRSERLAAAAAPLPAAEGEADEIDRLFTGGE